ncbi:MAG TPA: protein-L-isoaspartate(D-aspartate) O-methyltransferase [Vicinamibacteria bacterium]|nr:protein-L-isoaspartate(D-aspartate) O-methyltransferase [Vicinamibacteria bacterium]
MRIEYWIAIAIPVLCGPRAQEGQDERRDQRVAMVHDQIEERGVTDARVVEALRDVPRHLFVPDDLRDVAYEDYPLPIGYGQTISQPYIVGVMTQLLAPEPKHKILEIGTGSGYQAAVLSMLVEHVYTIEIIPELAEEARTRLRALGYDNITVITGDGYRGHPDDAPFDGIIVTAAPEEVPRPLLDQLRIGGRLVIPVGSAIQELEVIERTDKGYETRTVFPVRFVPMTGEAERKRPFD